MGRGNVYMDGPCEGLFYIDNDDFYVYRRDDSIADEPEFKLMGELDYAELTSDKWLFDEVETADEEEDILECFIADFVGMFPSFEGVSSSKWIGRYRRAILESGLFYIAVEDNQWSLAVELVQKQTPYDDCLLGLQAGHFQRYLDGMKMCLLRRLPSIGTYTGAWTSGTVKREVAE